MINETRVTAAVSEFLHIWASGGDATLTLDTISGECAINFSAHFGKRYSLLQDDGKKVDIKEDADAQVDVGRRRKKNASTEGETSGRKGGGAGSQVNDHCFCRQPRLPCFGLMGGSGNVSAFGSMGSGNASWESSELDSPSDLE